MNKRIETMLSALDGEINDAERRVTELRSARRSLSSVFPTGGTKATAKAPTVGRTVRLTNPPGVEVPKTTAAPVAKPKRTVSVSHPSQRVRKCACGSRIQGPNFFGHAQKCPEYQRLNEAEKLKINDSWTTAKK